MPCNGDILLLLGSYGQEAPCFVVFEGSISHITYRNLQVKNDLLQAFKTSIPPQFLYLESKSFQSRPPAMADFYPLDRGSPAFT